jgi:hypothetical protein
VALLRSRAMSSRALNRSVFHEAGSGVHFQFQGCLLSNPTGLGALHIQSRLPDSTWCLVDSNLSQKTIPDFIQEMTFFIVQAALPRLEHLEWSRKMPFDTRYYFLKPPTLQELIAA